MFTWHIHVKLRFCKIICYRLQLWGFLIFFLNSQFSSWLLLKEYRWSVTIFVAFSSLAWNALSPCTFLERFIDKKSDTSHLKVMGTSWIYALTTMPYHFIVEAQTIFNPSAREWSFRQPETPEGPGGTFNRLNFLSNDVNWDDLDKELNSYNWESEFDSPNIWWQNSPRYVPDHPRNSAQRENRKLSRTPSTWGILKGYCTPLSKLLYIIWKNP